MAENFIQKAIKRPGSLKAYAKQNGGIGKDGNINMNWARGLYNRLRAKAKGDKKLSDTDRKLLGKLQLFLKVLVK